MTVNTSAPLFDEAVSFATGPNSPMPAPLWVSVMPRTEGTWTSNRGRQYELDQVQTGRATTTLRNTDGALDADNKSGPYFGKIRPYRGYRRRAQYPATVNILTADQATAGFTSSLSALPPQTTSAFTVSIVSVTGSQAYSVPVGTAAHSSTQMIEFNGFSICPGLAYSFSVEASGSSLLTVRADITWYDAFGNVIFTSTGTGVTLSGTNQTVSITATAPTNCAGATVAIANTNVPTGSTTTLISFCQLEQADAPTEFVTPGTWYDLFTGYVERWPQTWINGGNYGLSNPQCIDAFGYLSQHPMLSPGYEEILGLDPDFFYPLDEPGGSVSFNDLTANNPSAGVTRYDFADPSKCAAGSTLDNSGGYLPSGIGGPVIQFTNPVDSSSDSTPCAVLDLTVAGIHGPPPSGGWTRIFAMTMPVIPTAGNSETVWGAGSNANVPDPDGAFAAVLPDGNLYVGLIAGGVQYPSAGVQLIGPVCDGSWHLVAIVLSADGRTCTTYLDNTPVAFTATADMHPDSSGGCDAFGANVQTTPTSIGFTNGGMKGGLSYVAQFSTALTSDQLDLIYSTFRYAGSGDGSASSASRFADILRWAGWAGAVDIEDAHNGTTTQYGPSVDLQAAVSDGGTDVVSALQTVTTTENGNQYVSAAGAVTFRCRGDRYARQPTITFGEDVANGEIPYTDAGFDNDVTRLANDTALTQTSTGLLFRGLDQDSIGEFGDVQLSANINTLDPAEIKAASQYILATEADPSQRLESIEIDVSANPEFWPQLLALELGTCARVMRRPPGRPPMNFNGFIESIAWKITDQARATVTLQLSPNFELNQQAGVWGTSRWGPAAGAMTVTCHAGDTSIDVVFVGAKFTLTSAAYPMTITVDDEQIELLAPPGGATSPQTFASIVRGANGTDPTDHTAAALSLVGTGRWTY